MAVESGLTSVRREAAPGAKFVTLRAWFSVTKVQFEFEVGFGFEFVIVDKKPASGDAGTQLEFCLELLIRILEAMIAVFLNE